MKNVIAMTDEARAVTIRKKGPSDKVLLKGLIGNNLHDIPDDRDIRWICAEVLKARGWKIRSAYVGGKHTLKPSGIIVAPGTKTNKRIPLSDASVIR